MSYLRYLCLFTHSGVQHIYCCAFVLFVQSIQENARLYVPSAQEDDCEHKVQVDTRVPILMFQ